MLSLSRLSSKTLWLCAGFSFFGLCLGLRFFTMPFLGDDANWMREAARLAGGELPWAEVFVTGMSSTGLVPHSFLTLAAFAVPYSIYPHVYSVVLLCAVSQLLALWIIVRIGEELGDWRAGMVAAGLLFVSPTYYLFYSLRIWNLGLLLLPLCLFLLFLVRFVGVGRASHYLWATFFLGLAANFHPTALVLLPLLWGGLVHRTLSAKVLCAAGAIHWFALSPFLVWAWAANAPMIFLGLAAGVFVPPLVLRQLALSPNHYWGLVLSGLCLWVAVWGYPKNVFPLSGWPMLISASWLDRSAGWAPSWLGFQTGVILAWLMGLSLLLRPQTPDRIKILLAGNLLAPIGLAAGDSVSAIRFQLYQFFFLPLFFLAVGVGLSQASHLAKSLRVGLAILIFGIFLGISAGAERRLLLYGGMGPYCSTLAQKLTVMRRILAEDPDAILTYPRRVCSGRNSWKHLHREMGDSRRQGTRYYLVEPWGQLFAPSDLKRLLFDTPDLQDRSLWAFEVN